MYFSSNLKLLRQRQNLSQEEMAGNLDITRSSLSGYENGTAEPNFSTLIRISNYFDVSLDKLLKTDLSVLSDLQLEEIEKGYDIDLAGNKIRVLATTVDRDDNENIELVPEKARAGYMAGYSDPEFIKVLPTFNLPFLSRDKKYRTFTISGDSMPPVPSGAFVTGEYVQNWNSLKSGYPYILVMKEEGIVFKIVYNRIKENKTLQLVSTNPLYEPYEVDVRNVLEVWKFVNYISGELPDPSMEKDDLTTVVMNLQKEIRNIKNVLREKK
jgi:transcriptional regulator with XRE-family HTH domain